MRKMPTHKKKQKGVALFVTLLVVTIATLLATEIWFNNTLDISRQYNNRSSYQAKHYANGMALYAVDVLRLDYEENATFDNRSEPWNQVITGIELDDAVLSGKLTDLDSKFNLNNLFINGAIDPVSFEYFNRVLGNLEIELSVADKIIDWIDPNQIPLTQGAEDSFYLSRSPSYRTAGQHFVHISELKLIDGINEQIYQRLKSYVTVLPIINSKPTKINVNTASSLLLKSLDNRISSKEAVNLYNDGNASHKSLQEFFNHPTIRDLGLGRQESSINTIINTSNQWYQAQVSVKMDNNLFQSYALMHRLSAIAVIKQWSETPYN
ncbi:MAG: type II secretion system minor pseudopilin GspK [Marinicellaceae bacterium]